MADADVKIPGLGDVPKKKALLIGGGVFVAVAAVLIIRSRNAASSAATTSTAADSTDGTDDGSDSQDLAAYDGSDAGYDEYGGDGGYSDDTDLDAAGYPIGSAQDLAYQEQTTTGISTNSEWLQEAETQLPGDQATIQAALSGVLGGLTVTTAQKNLFLEGVGILGAPPQGYPTPIKTSDTASQPTAAVKAPVPKVTGQAQEAAFAILSAAGFKATGTPVVKGKTLVVQSQTPAAGTQAAKGSTVTLHSTVAK